MYQHDIKMVLNVYHMVVNTCILNTSNHEIKIQHVLVIPCLELIGHNKNQISYHGSTKKLLEILFK